MNGTLLGRRILVVEDEYFIAMDIARALIAEGAEIAGPVARVDQGLALAEAEPLHAAVLDVGLAGGFSYAIADMLARRGIPHLLLTGYDASALPERFRNTPRLTKPVQLRAVASRLCTLWGDTVCH